MLASWIRANAERIEPVAALGIASPELLDHIHAIKTLYEDLWQHARAQVRTWGPAANAKTLHQLAPAVFVTWDKNIVPFARDYADFTVEMHRLALRMIEESPFASSAELEQRVQEDLGYRVRKTLAKYLDEFNWYKMVGAGRVARGG